MIARLSVLALAASLLPFGVEARPASIARRNRLNGEEIDSFVEERKDPNFACGWHDEPGGTGRRTFYCPSPCRLNEKAGRFPGEDLRPKHWQCPPTVSGSAPREQLCKWKRSGRLSCPSNCGWQRDSKGVYEWGCTTPTLLHAQTPNQRQQFMLGWASGELDRVELDMRSRYLCPAEELACPLRNGLDAGTTIVPSGSFECIDPRESLENCGGCASMPGSGGVDCTKLNAHAACVSGVCEISRCLSGYMMNENGTACESVVHATSL